MTTIQCGEKGAMWKYHDAEMIQTNPQGDDQYGRPIVQVEFLCLRCGHRWWEEFTQSELDRITHQDE